MENSNKGYLFDFDETTLIRKQIGIVLGEEEYENTYGTVKKRLYVHSVKTVEDIRKENFIVPKLKKYQRKQMLQNTTTAYEQGFYPIDISEEDENLPF